jgi:hypothetical protein
MAERKLHRASVETRPRFRCLVCKRFVEGTEHGSCPRCGWEPPRVELPRPPSESGSSVRVVVAGLLILVAIVLGWLAGAR